jgi:hypothetical protein
MVNASAGPRGYAVVPLIGNDKPARQIDQSNMNDFMVLRGAANRIRTCDPVITNDVLYQLSYCGGPCGRFRQRG